MHSTAMQLDSNMFGYYKITTIDYANSNSILLFKSCMTLDTLTLLIMITIPYVSKVSIKQRIVRAIHHFNHTCT